MFELCIMRSHFFSEEKEEFPTVQRKDTCGTGGGPLEDSLERVPRGFRAVPPLRRPSRPPLTRPIPEWFLPFEQRGVCNQLLLFLLQGGQEGRGGHNGVRLGGTGL